MLDDDMTKGKFRRSLLFCKDGKRSSFEQKLRANTSDYSWSEEKISMVLDRIEYINEQFLIIEKYPEYEGIICKVHCLNMELIKNIREFIKTIDRCQDSKPLQEYVKVLEKTFAPYNESLFEATKKLFI